LVEVPTVSQSGKRRLTDTKKGKKAQEQEQTLNGILSTTQASGDPLLARSICSACLAMDGTVSIGIICRELREVLQGMNWRRVREPGAVIVEQMKARIRILKLRTLDAVAETPAGCTCDRRGRCDYCKSRAKVH
jgi:hypothetical protein